ncbi:HAMP domain-containing sensor histidine kinase [Massilia sp. DJPM01]|uniref:sensor histidine kinase n=1 Tax=Massilia sp. DJPM01 TaxID=3024404 RepID=UPI00259FA41A|nr:HAMP domain-containing sensor histidine kinase [Massilia sp. DJPM01]MDM5177134.1 HAMP domain-containing sensor histidine kinase [Massilia sp. DJPM01]
MDGLEGAVASSLRFKLSLWLSIAIVIVAAAAGVFSFASATDDAHAMQDSQLGQTAYLISRLDAVPSSPLARERKGDDDFDARVVVRFLQTDNGKPAPVPARPPVFSNLLKDELQTVFVGKEQWRVFVKSNAKGVRVAVGQQTAVRDVAARANAVRTLMPILFLVPVLVLLVTVLVRQMFKPLKALSAELGRRPEHDLGQLNKSGLPSEVWPFVVEINELLSRMGRSMASQRRFIADAAHELRSPLTAMSLQAERLGATAMPEEARARLGALIAGLRRTRILLDQLLMLARIQGPSVVEKGSVSLDQVIREVLEDLVPLAEEKDIDLGVVGDVDARVKARLVDLKVLIKNLVDNAIRYTPDGGRVDITVQQINGSVILQVDDTGPGIPAHERERVFDPFYRVLGNGEIGSGLGLAIIRTVATGMGASIVLCDADPPNSGLRALVQFGGDGPGQAVAVGSTALAAQAGHYA